MNYDLSSFKKTAEHMSKLCSNDFYKALSPALQQLINSLGPYSEISHSPIVLVANEMAKNIELNIPAATADTISPMATNVYQSISTAGLADSIEAFTTAAAKVYASLNVSGLTSDAISAISSSAKFVLEESNNSEYLPEDDFITMDEAPIKEWEIPDTIAIPIGHNRIRMKTDIFIAFISGIVIPLIFSLAGLIVDLSTAISESQNEAHRIELEEERNNLINESNQLFDRYLDILDSTDTSGSSKADQFESWKESLPKPDSAPVTSDSTPDSDQESHNNSPE